MNITISEPKSNKSWTWIAVRNERGEGLSVQRSLTRHGRKVWSIYGAEASKLPAHVKRDRMRHDAIAIAVSLLSE